MTSSAADIVTVTAINVTAGTGRWYVKELHSCTETAQCGLYSGTLFGLTLNW